MTYGGVVGLIFIWGLYFGVIFNYLSANSTDILKKTSPIYAIAINTNILANISLCKSELDLFRDGVDKKKLWSLKSLYINNLILFLVVYFKKCLFNYIMDLIIVIMIDYILYYWHLFLG